MAQHRVYLSSSSISEVNCRAAWDDGVMDGFARFDWIYTVSMNERDEHPVPSSKKQRRSWAIEM